MSENFAENQSGKSFLVSEHNVNQNVDTYKPFYFKL